MTPNSYSHSVARSSHRLTNKKIGPLVKSPTTTTIPCKQIDQLVAEAKP